MHLIEHAARDIITVLEIFRDTNLDALCTILHRTEVASRTHTQSVALYSFNSSGVGGANCNILVECCGRLARFQVCASHCVGGTDHGAAKHHFAGGEAVKALGAGVLVDGAATMGVSETHSL